MNKYQVIKDAARKFPHIDVPLITERVQFKIDFAKKWMGLVYRGTELEGLENYPKRTGKPL